MVDDRDMIWVIVGEWYWDNIWHFTIESTIDIFDEYGTFLYTFKSPVFGLMSQIKHGKLFTRPTTEDDRYVHVYKIHYGF